jgi:hypothetical protein
MPRRGDYLFKRKGSQNWWLRLQYSGRAVEIMGTKKVETSLQTPDRQEAEIRAFDQIKAHKLTLLILRNQREQTIQTNKEPYALGEHRTHDGERFIATENGLIFLAEDGSSSALNRIIRALSFGWR